LQITRKIYSKNIASLSATEINDTSLAMQALQLSIEMEDKNLIQTKTES